MGGALCGATLMEGIAQGVEASKTIEVILQTGKASRTYGLRYDKKNCERYLQHEGAVSAPLVKPANAEGYTEEEVKAEAARCLQCDCTKCIDCCEMLKYFRKNPHKIAVEVFNDMGVNPPFSVRTVTREVYSCNICGYCKSVCPVDVDMGKLIQFSRTARMSAGIHPSALHDFWLREMDFAVSEGSFVSAPAGKETCAYVFYPGCQLGASNPDHVLMSYEFLSKNYDAGIFLGCCGAPAYWAGDEGRMRANTEKIKKCWGDLGNPAFIYACPTCASMLSLFLPEINKISLYELLAQSDEIAPERIFPEAAIFDPCAARDYDQMQADIRKLAVKAGVYLEELKAPNHCCGYGGHIRIAKPDLYNEIAQHRIEASPKPYIAYCANCKEVFLSQGKECVHILDMAFGLKGEARIPSLQQKRENSLVVKKEMMKKTRDIDYSPERHEWDGLILKIGDEVQRAMEERLISADDLKEAIWQAETSGDKFYDESDGMFMCSMVRPVITYWTQYKKTAPDTYEIFSAYSHRMRFNVEE
jgi:Fe-S oxidoreductase